MRKKLYEQYETLVTRLRHKAQMDPFFLARAKIVILYFTVGAIISIAGWLWGYAARLEFYPIAVTQNGPIVEAAIRALEQKIFQERIVLLLVFGVAAYVLTELVIMRPIKKFAELQARFVAIVSHELRTPVTIMQNAAEVALRNENLSREKAIAVLKSNLEETEHLAHTIQFLLTFSALRNRKQLENFRNVSFAEMIGKVRALLERVARDEGINLAIDGDLRAQVFGNPVALEGVIVNLVTNAVHHSPKGRTVQVQVAKTSKRVRLSVRDEGEGIRDEDLNFIFEPFYRGTHAPHVQGRGTGLGLSIVKEIAEFHHATISVTSKRREGTVFGVDFPIPRVQ